jgi:hypothetical protein
MAAGDPGVLKRNFSATAIETTLVNSISSAATGDTTTSVSVVSVSGYPSVPFTLILAPDTNKEEVVTCISVVGTTLQIIRGQDATLAVSHTAGTAVRHGVSGRDFKEEQTHIAARGYDADTGILSNAGQTHVHGLESGDGSVVGSTQAVTLTRKTLTTPTVNGATITGTVTASTATFGSPTLTTPTVNGATLTGTVTATTATIASPTITSPTISGSPVITGLSSAGMSASSATPKDYVDAILGSATAAATSAASAAASATAAATSATSSATSASAAATSASSALAAQTASATSATSAAASATAAATSATSAAASATAAATSATSAAASATTAAASVAAIAAYATSSANSASAAATSATSAAASESAAATSAASAATSASTMGASVTAAATSAASAAASATAAATSATSAATSASSALTSQTAAATSATSAATSASSALTSETAAATSAASAATSATSAATTYDNFDDRYLGSKSSAPTVDNDGNTLLVGAIYWNSTLNNMYVWSGSAWVQIATTSVYTAPTLGSTTIASGTTYGTVTGLTLSGGLAAADPSVALGIATKQYVDSVVTQINYHQAVVAATTANLNATYSNGTSGVGATLTNAGTQAAFSTDGVSPVIDARVLVKNQTTQTQNGIYTLTTVGDGSTNWVLTRATDADNNPTGEMKNGDELSCVGGTVNAGKSFINSTTVDPIVIGTTAITFSEYYSSLPAQTGNSGKYLTTDGSVPSWQAIITDPLPQVLMLGGM